MPQPRRVSCCVSWGRGNIKNRRDVLPVFGVVTPCDGGNSMMSQSAPVWRCISGLVCRLQPQ